MMRYQFIFSLMMVVALVLSCNKDEDQIASFTDARDGQTYRIVTIGNQVWMAENLNYIPTVGMSWCYDDNSGTCEVRGRLYSQVTAVLSCPAGWHLPDETEWDQLNVALGGTLVSGGKLKATGFDRWYAPNTGATNESGFTGLPFGGRTSVGSFTDYGKYGYWWTNSLSNPVTAYFYSLSYSNDELIRDSESISFGLSVRCIKD
ncbi:MAG: hypothetical protein GY751_12685 [Bacteroidetes bacterium]|nr:hypothetical protein [Bacteroidota bacterium]